jgi:hypothetical protein
MPLLGNWEALPQPIDRSALAQKKNKSRREKGRNVESSFLSTKDHDSQEEPTERLEEKKRSSASQLTGRKQPVAKKTSRKGK